MQEVRTGECFCPRIEDVTFKACLNPPNVSYLVDGIVHMVQNNRYDNERDNHRYNRLAIYLKKNAPEKQWLLGLLALLAPDNEVFVKGYMPPHRMRAEVEAQMIDNNDGFFNGLHTLNSK